MKKTWFVHWQYRLDTFEDGLQPVKATEHRSWAVQCSRMFDAGSNAWVFSNERINDQMGAKLLHNGAELDATAHSSCSQPCNILSFSQQKTITIHTPAKAAEFSIILKSSAGAAGAIGVTCNPR